MFKTVITFTRQRFSPLLFGGLTLFLFLFAKGNLNLQLSDYFWLPLLVVLLFIFRLFDDLENRNFDELKPNRSYTEPENYHQLRKLLAAFSVVTFAVLIALNPAAGIATFSFFLLNLLLYKLLLYRWKFRNILPLLKYPFLVLLLAFLFQPEQVPGLNQVAVSLILFPAFLLYETLTDETFPLPDFIRALLFTSVFLPFLPAFSFALPGLIFAGFAIVFLLALLFIRHQTIPYFLLFFLLFTRLMLPE